LHDEVVAVAARWLDPATRKEALKPYADESETKTLELLEVALATPELHHVPKIVSDRFVQSAPRDVEDLLGHLQKRSELIARQAEEKLAARGEKEAKDMAEIIQGQRKRIQAAFDTYEKERQMPLAFEGLNEMEVSQLEADHRYWQKRLTASEQELVREPARIREGYVVKAKRIEPVGLVYLWPISG
jgi:hypothetical protein